MCYKELWEDKFKENDMAQKFFGTIFERRKIEIADSKTNVSELKPIKPALDIADFEYPPESSFYRDLSDHS